MKKTLILALADRNPILADVLDQNYRSRGFRVVRSSAEKKEDVSSFFDQLEETAELICIYFPYPVYEISIFDESFIDNMADSLDKGLYAGTWWIQQSAGFVKSKKITGNVIILNHAASVVPTQRYSYCSIPEAALTNLGKVAAMDTADELDFRVNFVTYGWYNGDDNEMAFLEELMNLHKGSKAPILEVVNADEIAMTCLAAESLKGMNGNNLFVDKGFTISRTIRQL